MFILLILIWQAPLSMTTMVCPVLLKGLTSKDKKCQMLKLSVLTSGAVLVFYYYCYYILSKNLLLEIYLVKKPVQQIQFRIYLLHFQSSISTLDWDLLYLQHKCRPHNLTDFSWACWDESRAP